jgi:hypothetical protein
VGAVEPGHGLDATRQRRIGVRDALGEVETALATAASGRAETWAETMVERLTALKGAWRHHVDQNEAADGLFAQILEDSPRLSSKVDRLRGDHESISSAVDAALERTRAAATGGGGVEPAREAVVALLESLVRHRYQGAEVVYEAYNVDIEAGD